MKAATRATLQEAYRLITTGEPDGARALIKPVLAKDKENIDAWWLAVHAAATPHDRRLALVQVLRLKPTHRPAQVMLNRLNTANPDEIDELADDLPLPPPGHQARDLVRPHQRRWLWNAILGVGCLSFMFASAALISGITGMNWFEKTVNHVVGVKPEHGAGGQLGTVQGGDPQHPYEIPVTDKEAVVPSGDPIVNEINPDEAHVYTFQAMRGDEVVALLQFTIPGDAHYAMELYDSGYRKLATGVASDNGATVNLVYEIAQDGQYALIVIGRPNGPRGGYALGLDVLKP